MVKNFLKTSQNLLSCPWHFDMLLIVWVSSFVRDLRDFADSHNGGRGVLRGLKTNFVFGVICKLKYTWGLSLIFLSLYILKNICYTVGLLGLLIYPPLQKKNKLCSWIQRPMQNVFSINLKLLAGRFLHLQL